MSRSTKQFSPSKLALIMVAALGLVWLLQPTLSEWLANGKSEPTAPKIELNPNQAEPTVNGSPTVPALMPGVDPFKAHIEKNGVSPTPLVNPPASTHNNSTNSKPLGADPFKAFIEQQKQQNKDAGVSPFGK
jgi:hypothetical protein